MWQSCVPEAKYEKYDWSLNPRFDPDYKKTEVDGHVIDIEFQRQQHLMVGIIFQSTADRHVARHGVEPCIQFAQDSHTF